MRGKKISALFLGLAAVAAMLFSSVPTLAAEGSADVVAGPTASDVGAQAFRVLRNRGLPSNMCLANHHPTVFMYGGCTGQYRDQYWQFNGYGQLVNLYSGACVAMHGDGRVFTFDCGPRYADQIWRNYNGITGMLENNYHRGLCIAAHADGSVFGFRCTPAYNDQYWYWTN